MAEAAAPQTAKDILMSPGFFSQPEDKQISALGAVDQPFKGYPAERQKKILSGLKLVSEQQALTGGGAAPPPGPPVAGAPPAGVPGKPRQTPGLKPSPLDPKPGGPLLEALRPAVTKAAGAVTGAIPKFLGAPKQVSEFSAGIGEGLGNLGIDMTSIANLALTAGTAMPIGKIGKLGKVVNIVKRLASAGFTAGAGLDALFVEVPEAKAAYDAGDHRAMGNAVSKALADLYFVRLGTKSGKSAKEAQKAGGAPKVPPETSAAPPPGPPETTHDVSRETVTVGGKPKEVVERVRKGAGETKAASPVPTEPMSKDQIERRIGTLEESRTGKASDASIDREIRDLTQTLKRMDPATSTDPSIAAQGWAERWKGEPPKPKQERPSPDVPVTGPQQGAARKKAAEERAANQDVTKTWRQWGEGLGIRLAPEEIGELPRQAPPVERPIVGSGKAAPPPGPEVPPIERGQSGSDLERNLNPEGQRFTSDKLPGIPKGATVIPRGMSPEGMLVDVVDSNNRTIQKTLPFRDSIGNMVSKGWMTKQGGAKGSAGPVNEPVPADKPSRVKGLIEGPGGAAPPPGPIKILTPQELAAAQRIPGQKMLPEAIHVRGAEKTPEQQLELAKGQPAEVIQGFVDRMKRSFLEQFAGIDPKKLSPEQQQQMVQAYEAMQAYLKPYEALAAGKSGKGAGGAPEPKKLEPAGGAPSSNPKEVASVSKSIFEQATSGGLEEIKVTLKDSSGKELASQVFPASSDPAALAQFIGQAEGVQRLDI